jgi:hypothetical protein
MTRNFAVNWVTLSLSRTSYLCTIYYSKYEDVMTFRTSQEEQVRKRRLKTVLVWKIYVLTYKEEKCSLETLRTTFRTESPRGLISLWFYKENNNLRDWKKNVFTLYIPPWTPHTYDFVVLISLTHPKKILLVLLQIEKYEKKNIGK